MSVDTFEVSNVGQIAHASVALREFTVIVGPQASGKSIFLQLFKLALDHSSINSELKRYSFDWGNDSGRFWDLYFGEGAHGLFRKESSFAWNGEGSPLSTFKPGKARTRERVFYIPAQRVLTLDGGWPKNFLSFDPLDPFVVKHFSETLRLMADKEIAVSGSIFPLDQRFDEFFTNLISTSVYYGAEVSLDKESPKKRLTIDLDSSRIPFMSWSAGQREFTPLLLSMLWLTPKLPRIGRGFDSIFDVMEGDPGEAYGVLKKKYLKRDSIDFVILEEPEMGLHPDAIKVVIAMTMFLHLRGYKVVLSTHSPVILEFFWALKELTANKKDIEKSMKHVGALIDLIGLPSYYLDFVWLLGVRSNSFGAYFFDRTPEGVVSRDISSLDPSSDEDAVAAWGRLTDFSSKVSEIVSKAHA